MDIYKNLPPLYYPCYQTFSDGNFPLQERISNLALQVISDSLLEGQSFFHDFSRDITDKEIQYLAPRVNALVPEILNWNRTPLQDLDGILALKHAILSGHTDCHPYWTALSTQVQDFLKDAYGEVFQSNFQMYHPLKTFALLFIGDQSIFDYIHASLKSGVDLYEITFDSVSLNKRDLAIDAAPKISAALFRMLFVQMTNASDVKQVQQLICSLPANVQQSFFTLCRTYYPEILLTHFLLFKKHVSEQDIVPLVFELVKSNLSYLKYLPQIPLNEEQKKELLTHLCRYNGYENSQLINSLAYFEIQNPTTLIEIIQKMPPEYQGTALTSAQVTDQTIIDQVVKNCVSQHKENCLEFIDSFPLSTAGLGTLKIEIIKNSKLPMILNSFFKDGTLIYSKEFLFATIERLLYQAADMTNPQIPEILNTLSGLMNEESHTDLMPIVWGITLDYIRHIFSEGKLPYHEQLKTASSWVLFIHELKSSTGVANPLSIVDFFSKTTPDLVKFASAWRSQLQQGAFLDTLSLGMFSLAASYEKAFDIPAYVFEQIIPSIATNYYAKEQLHHIFSSKRREDPFYFLLALLQLAPLDKEKKLSEKAILTALKPDFKAINDDVWSYLETWGDIKDPQARHRTFEILAQALTRTPLNKIPPTILKYVIPAIAKSRNEELFSALKHKLSTILQDSTEVSHYQALIAPDSGATPLAYLILPMLLLCDSKEAAALDQIKTLLHTRQRRIDMKNVDTGLSHTIQMAALSKLPLLHFQRGLEQGVLQQIKTALCQLQFLHSKKYLERLAENWSPLQLTALVNSYWQEVFGVDFTAIENFDERFSQFFHSPRMQGKLEIYSTKQEESLKPYIGEFIQSVLTDTFHARRYDTSCSSHLLKLQEEYPEIYLKWQESTPPIPLFQKNRAHIVTQDFVKEVFLNARTHNHLGDYHIQDSFEACGDNSIEQLIVQLMNDAPNIETVKKLIEVLTALPTPPELLNDVKGLLAEMQPRHHLSDFHIMITDDPIDTFLCGTEVPGSCQRIDGNPHLNQCLLAYVLDGKNKLIAIKDMAGSIVARRIFRLLFDEKGAPALFLERHYGSHTETLKQALLDHAVAYATSLHLPLYIQEFVENTLRSSTRLSSLGSSVPFEYVDAASGGTDGTYTLQATTRLSTQPIDYDLVALQQALSVKGPIPYTQVIHDAAYAMNEKLSSDKWGDACRSYIAATGDSFPYNGEKPAGRITEPERLLAYLEI